MLKKTDCVFERARAFNFVELTDEVGVSILFLNEKSLREFTSESFNAPSFSESILALLFLRIFERRNTAEQFQY